MTSAVELEDYFMALSLSLDLIDSSLTFGKANERSDLAIAINLTKEELENEMKSYTLAKSMSNAISTDGVVLQSFHQREEMEFNDRQLASALGRKYIPASQRTKLTFLSYSEIVATSPSTPNQARLIDIGQGFSNRLESKLASDSEATVASFDPPSILLESSKKPTASLLSPVKFGKSDFINDSTSSNYVSSSSKYLSSRIVKCASCIEDIKLEKGTMLLCNHFYCTPCLSNLGSSSLGDRSLIPLRCCKIELPDRVVRSLFNQTEFEKYTAFLNEIKSPEYAVAKLDSALDSLVIEKGWKRCPKCSIVIDRWSGCVHMRCFCSHEFCHKCLATWRNCQCELFTQQEVETMLDERLEPHEVNRRDIRNRLRDVIYNHYNHNHQWGFRHGMAVCGECNWTMPKFYFSCRTCREIRCGRCKNNRI